MDPTPTPTGNDVQVNSFTSNDQLYPSVTKLENGGFVVTWSSFGQDGSGYGVYARLFDANGEATDSEFRVNTATSQDQFMSNVTALAGGGFVITWTDSDNLLGNEIRGQLFSPSGVPIGGEIHINSFTGGDQIYSSVAALADGGFVAAWSSSYQDGSNYGVYAQRFDEAGAPVGDEFRANTTTILDQFLPSVATTVSGSFVITWTSATATGFDIYGQRYDATATAVGSEFRVNSYTTDDQSYASTTALGDGGFLVTWLSYGQDGSEYGVYGQRYDADGAALGSEFRVNTATAGNQIYASSTALDDGGFVVTWSSYGQDGSGYGVYGQRYDAAGTAVGNEFQVNQVTAGDQLVFSLVGKSIAVLDDGKLAVVWAGASATEEVFFRLIDVPPVCFLAGTMIRTPAGETAVEKLEIGDRVLTLDGRALPVRFIGRQTIVSRFADHTSELPICIRAGALGHHSPARDLYTSPGHAIFLDGMLVVAGALVNGTTVHRMAQVPARFTYFHIELEEHELIFAEGAATESYCNNVPRDVFDNAAAYRALYPQPPEIRQLDLPTVKSARQLPRATRRMLDSRAREAAA